MSLVARHLEANGIPTVVVGSARDVVEQAGVPRFVFVDYPLGNPMGKPYDTDEQRLVFGLALDLLEKAFVARTTVQAPLIWDESEEWRANFMRVDDELRAKLAAEGEARRQRQEEAKHTGKARDV